MAFRDKAQEAMRNVQDKARQYQSLEGTGGKAFKVTVAGGRNRRRS